MLARGLTTDQSSAIRAAIEGGAIAQVRLEPEAVRVYPLDGGAPKTTIAAHLLGFVNREGVGQYGVEGRWQETLAGAPTIVVAERDATGRPNLERATTLEAGSPGVDVTLTIDASLQLAVEREVYAAWVADRAKSVSAVVMDPATGEILAEATYPSYDANGYAAVAASSPERFLDPVVGAVYEPGSVFKMVTAATVLEAGVVKRTSRVRDQAILRLDDGKAFVHERRQGLEGQPDVRGRGGLVAQRRDVARSPSSWARPPRRRPRCSTTCGHGSASAPRPAWTSPARCPGSCVTRRGRPGARSTSPTARSGRAWR